MMFTTIIFASFFSPSKPLPPTLRKSSAPPRPAPPKVTSSTKPTPPKKPLPQLINKGPRAKVCTIYIGMHLCVIICVFVCLCVKALYNYNGQYHDELSFNEGVTIKLINKQNADWYEVCNM